MEKHLYNDGLLSVGVANDLSTIGSHCIAQLLLTIVASSHLNERSIGTGSIAPEYYSSEMRAKFRTLLNNSRERKSNTHVITNSSPNSALQQPTVNNSSSPTDQVTETNDKKEATNTSSSTCNSPDQPAAQKKEKKDDTILAESLH